MTRGEPPATLPRPARPASLSRRLSLAAGAAFLVVFAGLVTLSVRHFSRTHEQTIGEQQALLANTVSADLDAQMQHFAGALRGNVKRISPALLADPQEARRYLANRPTLQAVFDDGLALFDASGHLIASEPEGARAWPDPLLSPAGAGGLRVSAPFAGPSPRQPSVALSVPIPGPDGAPAGWISGRVQVLGASLGAHYAAQRIGRGGYFSVVTAERVVMIHHDPRRILGPSAPPGVNRAVDRGLAGFEGWLPTVTSAGVEMISGLKRVPTTGWLVLANYPAAQARAPFKEAWVWYAFASAGGALAAFTLLWLGLRRLTQPLVEMTREVEALATGGAAGARPIAVPGTDEVGTLAMAFNRLLEERGRAEAAASARLAELRQSEARHRAVLRSAPVVQWAIDADGRFTLSEGLGLGLLGLAPGQVVGMSVFDVYKGQEGVLADYHRAALGESFVSTTQLGPATFETHWGPLRDAEGRITGVTGIAIDLTARRRAEEQLLQAQKMEAVGRLASGIAHDFNNVLTAVLGGTSFLLERKDLGAEVREEVDQIQRAGERAAALVRQLLAFSRKSSFHPVVTDLAALVAGLEPLLKRAIGEHIQVQTALPADPWPVRVDASQLDQVLMNLAVNARDAMPRGGTLRLEVQNRQDGPRREACVLVADTGVGMTPEVQARLFEPFFTTKERGRGTGLGLSTAFGIVQQAGGRISCESSPGKGTTFTLAFPVADQPAAARGLAPGVALPAGRGQTVLVVEDDDAVRRSTARMVREAGFVAVEAASGEEALRAVEAARVDLVLTDVLMPGMLGPELAARLKALHPALPVVFVSGYLDQNMHALPPGAELLAKPFDKAALLGLLGRVLARGGARPRA